MGVWWSFRCYLDARGADVIEAWYEAQPDELQAKFDTDSLPATAPSACVGPSLLRHPWKRLRWSRRVTIRVEERSIPDHRIRLRRNGIHVVDACHRTRRQIRAKGNVRNFSEAKKGSRRKQETRA